MKREFRIDLTELAGDDETRRTAQALMASASGNTANQDADRFVAVGAGQDDGKVETAERGRFVAEGDDKIEAGDRSRFVAVGTPDDGKIDDVLSEGASKSVRVGGDKYVAISDDKIFD